MPDQPEVYPMPMFPVLFVGDVVASVEWYTNMLGFASLFTLPAPGGGIAMAHLRWRRYADLLLVPDAGPHNVARPHGALGDLPSQESAFAALPARCPDAEERLRRLVGCPATTGSRNARGW